MMEGPFAPKNQSNNHNKSVKILARVPGSTQNVTVSRYHLPPLQRWCSRENSFRAYRLAAPYHRSGGKLNGNTWIRLNGV
jgi:hypothetical protein